MTSKNIKILIVDDEEAICFTLKNALEKYSLTVVMDAKEAIDLVKIGTKYDILIIDFRLPTLSGLDILNEAKKFLDDYRAILITAYSSRDLLEEVLNKDLVFKITNKPFTLSEINDSVKEAVNDLAKERTAKKYFVSIKKQLTDCKRILLNIDNHSGVKHTLIYSSEKIDAAIALARKFAATDDNILITGESGVGKDIFANLIHKNSNRAEKPLIILNCSSIPESLFESEMFGTKKGAYTGSMADREGKFQLADKGTRP